MTQTTGMLLLIVGGAVLGTWMFLRLMAAERETRVLAVRAHAELQKAELERAVAAPQGGK